MDDDRLPFARSAGEEDVTTSLTPEPEITADVGWAL
jgi:hypothetical protein